MVLPGDYTIKVAYYETVNLFLPTVKGYVDIPVTVEAGKNYIIVPKLLESETTERKRLFLYITEKGTNKYWGHKPNCSDMHCSKFTADWSKGVNGH